MVDLTFLASFSLFDMLCCRGRSRGGEQGEINSPKWYPIRTSANLVFMTASLEEQSRRVPPDGKAQVKQEADPFRCCLPSIAALRTAAAARPVCGGRGYTFSANTRRHPFDENGSFPLRVAI